MPMEFPPLSDEVSQFLQAYAEGKRDFSSIVLDECSLSGAKLSQIVLQGAHLRVVNLSNANLSHSNLRRAVLNVSRLSGANLSQAQLQQAQLNVTNLIQAVLIGANLSQASLIRAELLRADLSNTNLGGANLQEADLREARLRWANLEGAFLVRANLRNSQLIGANLNHAQGSSANLEGARLSGASLVSAELRHANLRMADLSGTNLRGANLRWANLSGANLREADLTDARLSGADLMGAQLEGATLENTILVHADLKRADLRRSRCVNADFSGATLTGAQMYGTVAYDVQTTDMICDWIDLSPQGDQSQKRHFNTGKDVHTFLNQRPPQVNVVVDQVMSLTAHAALAKVYAQLEAVSPMFSRPPNIELTNRRTILKFVAVDETGLSAIAYLATWPFQDGKAIQQILAHLVCQTVEEGTRALRQSESCRELYTVIEGLRQRDLAPLRKVADEHAFFATPIQVKLLNAKGRSLELYHNARFGTRSQFNPESLFPVESTELRTPNLEDYLAFLVATAS